MERKFEIRTAQTMPASAWTSAHDEGAVRRNRGDGVVAVVRSVQAQGTRHMGLFNGRQPRRADRVRAGRARAAVPMCEHDRETGRSVYSPTNGIASCAGYHPAEQPDCVIVVSCVRPKDASAGPDEARSVFTDILNLLSRNTGRSRR